MQCEICGKNIIKNIYVSLDGAVLSVCEECSKYGSVVKESKPPRSSERGARESIKEGFEPIRGSREPEKIYQLKPDYSEIIKSEREKRNLRQEALARILSEKPSVISKLETGKMEPDQRLIKKIEKLFGLELMELTEEGGSKIVQRGSDLTLGDIINVKKKRDRL